MSGIVFITDFKVGDDVPEWIERVQPDGGTSVSIKFGMDVAVTRSASTDDFPVAVYPKYKINDIHLPLIKIEPDPIDGVARVLGAPTRLFRYPRGDERNNQGGQHL